ncbi:MAG: reverse transcriptase N-terminal domain-containing protein [Acetatifactor sp.]|nr:reverse transcriptase N-terminal domain-containing protein [Acetatifactor sp.]
MNGERFNDTICENTPHRPKGWKEINWTVANEYVNRLQVRIVKATKAKNWNLVKRLQYLLTHSFYAKALAVKKVTQNKGKNTLGIDNQLWTTDKEKWKGINELQSRGYKALPTKRVLIPKKNGKKRPLSIPTIKDRAMQTLYLFALQPVEETTADEHSYGFRLNRGCKDACEQAFAALSLKGSAQWILEGDIKGCFDNISHEWMLKNITMDKRILAQFIQAGYVFQRQLFPTSKGAIQGGAISPTLANMVLDGLETHIWNNTNLGARGVVKTKNLHKVHMIRYADDFIVTGDSKEVLIKVQESIKEYWTGMRLGELLALSMNDIDFAEKTITIRKSYQRIKGRDVITEPKTERGKRVISMPDFLSEELQDYVGKIYGLQESDRIFQITKSYLEHEMERGIGLAGVKKIRLHDIRHSHASMLISQLHAEPLLVAQRLGHEKIQTTLDTYSHLYPDQSKNLANLLNQVHNEKGDDINAGDTQKSDDSVSS